MGDQQSLDKAAEVAQKLAASTNTKANPAAASSGQWGLPFGFNPYMAPPTYGGFGYGGYGMQGMSFSCPTPQPHAIPQMQQTKNAQSSSNNALPPGFNPAQFSQIPPPLMQASSTGHNNFSSNVSNFSNYGNFSQSNQSWGTNQQSNNSNNQQQTQGGGGPKPVRFSLPAKRGGGVFNTTNNQQSSATINKTNSINSNSFSGGNKGGLVGTQQNSVGFQNSALSYTASNSQNNVQQNKSSSNDYQRNIPNNFGSNQYSSNNSSSMTNNPNQRNIQSNGNPGSGFQQQSTSKDITKSMDPSDWPPSLQQYVFRCYELCASPVDKDRVDIILRGKVTRAAQDGVLQTKDWSKEPLPEISTGGQVKMLPFAPIGPIKGKITGKPLKTDDYLPGRGSGNMLRGGRGGGGAMQKQTNKGRTSFGQPGKGRGGRNAFGNNKAASPSRSRSRSSDSDSSSSSSSEYAHKKSKRRRRSSSDSNSPKKQSHKQSKMQKKKDKRKAKASKLNEKKFKEIDRVERVHMYSEHGLMQLDEDCGTTAKKNARAARFAKENKTSGKAKTGGPRPTMRSRLGGFAGGFNQSSNGGLWTIDSQGNQSNYEDNDWSGTVVIGTSTDLEKKYLRLTTAPDPSTIRPESILKESLELVKRKWKETQDYFYACDQLKSIRQDLTVQRIRNDFTVYVYETHARIALEKGDHEEYNQCQSQLVQLYDAFPQAANKVEFTAYRILYCIFTANTLDLGDVMSKLTEEVKKDECVSHALELQAAWACKNYSKFFKLHANAPKMAAYLIDWFANRERKHALKAILKAYRPSIPTSFVKEQLGLPLDSDWEEFLSSTDLENTILYMDSPINSKINAKDSFPIVMSALS